jgi:rare lipoprotein A
MHIGFGRKRERSPKKCKNHLSYELFSEFERRKCAFLFLLHALRTRYDRGVMFCRPHRFACILALLPASLLLFDCGKKHHSAHALPPVPLLHSGETGLASWYGHPYHGRAAANGEIYDMEKLTAAHRTLPFGTWVRVTNVANDKSVEVRITDRGPFVGGRIIDLSHAAAEVIDMIGPGVARVRLDIISAPVVASAENWYAVQAGAFREKERAENLRASLEREYGSARLVFRGGDVALWRVLIGREPSEESANVLAQKVRQEAGAAFVVRLDK